MVERLCQSERGLWRRNSRPFVGETDLEEYVEARPTGTSCHSFSGFSSSVEALVSSRPCVAPFLECEPEDTPVIIGCGGARQVVEQLINRRQPRTYELDFADESSPRSLRWSLDECGGRRRVYRGKQAI